VLDAVALEERGIPTVTFVTAPFVAAARSIARTRGIPDLELVVIPHDYLVEDDGEVAARLEPVFGDVCRALTR
jgi:hypothetical protein